MTTYTQEQTAIITHVADKPNEHLMASARAGSGKTFTIEEAAKGIIPCLSVLAIAFNKRIAVELEKRLPSSITCKTFNAIGHGAWGMKIGQRCRLDADKVYNTTRKVMQELSVDDPEGEHFRCAMALVRGAKSSGLIPKGTFGNPKGVVEDTDEAWDELAFDKGFDLEDVDVKVAKRVLALGIKDAYSGIIDFDDQIYMSVLFGGVFKKYHTVLVDEAQDLSVLNRMILEKMVGTRLIAIGDPYQAIYGFRGADSQSMPSLQKFFNIETVLTLSYTFRCSQAVVARQLGHVPDFKAHESCKPGSVEHWPKRNDPVGQTPASWSVLDCPEQGFILCRNNAPLIKLAFAFIRSRRPVKILGRDIGASLATLLKKIVGKQMNTSTATCRALVNDWRNKELEKVEGRESKKEAIHDRHECLMVLLDASECENAGDVCDFIERLFSDTKVGLTLSTGHKAKGLEESWVMFLDPWRIPSKFANRQADQGNFAPLEQEKNLKYVIETRTKDVLVIANLEDCAEIEREGDA